MSTPGHHLDGSRIAAHDVRVGGAGRRSMRAGSADSFAGPEIRRPRWRELIAALPIVACAAIAGVGCAGEDAPVQSRARSDWSISYEAGDGSLARVPASLSAELPSAIGARRRGWILSVDAEFADSIQLLTRGAPVRDPTGATIGFVDSVDSRPDGGAFVAVGRRADLVTTLRWLRSMIPEVAPAAPDSPWVVEGRGAVVRASWGDGAEAGIPETIAIRDGPWALLLVDGNWQSWSGRAGSPGPTRLAAFRGPLHASIRRPGEHEVARGIGDAIGTVVFDAPLGTLLRVGVLPEAIRIDWDSSAFETASSGRAFISTEPLSLVPGGLRSLIAAITLPAVDPPSGDVVLRWRSGLDGTWTEVALGSDRATVRRLALEALLPSVRSATSGPTPIQIRLERR